MQRPLPSDYLIRCCKAESLLSLSQDALI